MVNVNFIFKRGRATSVIEWVRRGRMGGGGAAGTLLGLGNVDCASWLRVGKFVLFLFFYYWYHVPIISTV